MTRAGSKPLKFTNMIRLLFITLLAAIWFYGLPFYDMFFNHSRMNTAEVHWLTQTWSGNLCMLIGIPLVIIASVKFFLPTKKPRPVAPKQPTMPAAPFDVSRN